MVKFLISILRFTGKAIKIIRVNSNPIFKSKINYLENNCIITKYNKQEISESYHYFKKFFSSSVLFYSKEELLSHALKTALENNKENLGLYLEFGVRTGKSINFLSNKYPFIKFYGFDSFFGLSEDWVGKESHPKNTFNLNGIPPTVNNNVELVIGEIKDTLHEFIINKKKKIDFIHIDVDTYESTKLILNHVKTSLSKKAIIVFDELHNISGWRQGEFRALEEVFFDRKYKFVSFSNSTNAAIIIED